MSFWDIFPDSEEDIEERKPLREQEKDIFYYGKKLAKEREEGKEFEVSKPKSLLHAGTKGVAKGATGTIQLPITVSKLGAAGLDKVLGTELSEKLTQKSKLGEWLSKKFPKFSSLVDIAADPGQTREEIQKRLPTQEGFLEGLLERGGEFIGAGALMGAPNIVRSLIAGAVGQGLEEMGAPGWLQSAGEIAAHAAPGFRGGPGGKMIAPKGQEELVEAARRLGLTDKQIAPLVQQGKLKEWLTKIASRRGATPGILQEAEEGLHGVFKNLKKHKGAKVVLSTKESENVLGKIQEKLLKTDAWDSAKIRRGFQKLTNSPRAGEDFIEFYRTINKSGFGGQLKGVRIEIQNSLNKISPSLGSDFKITNQLYTNYKNISSKLKPSLMNDIFTYGLPIFSGMVFGHFPGIATVVGEVAAKKIATKMLTNPKFQNLTKQMVNALNRNKPQIANAVWKNMTKLTQKESPEVALEMGKVNIEDLFKST